MMDFKEGEVLYFNKPLGWTSFKVVGHARYHICRRMKVKKLKVGHAGTLDPLATGVMIVCTGKATKRIEEFQYHTKEYIATIRLGATTPSYDLEHEITSWSTPCQSFSQTRGCGSLRAACWSSAFPISSAWGGITARA